MSYIPYIDPNHYGNFFQIDDVSTPIDPAAEHFVISGYGTYGAPERDVTPVSIPGRNGDLIFDNGRFTNAEVFYDIGWARGFSGELMYDNGANNLLPLLATAWSEELYRVQISYDGNGAYTFNRAVGAGAGAAIIISGDFHLTRGSYFLSVPTAGAVTLGIAKATTASTATEVFDTVDCRDRGGFIAIPYETDVCLVLVAHDGEGFNSVTVSPSLVTSQAARNPYTGFDYFRGQLMSKANTYYKLTDSYHPGEYRMARVARIEEISTTALNDGGRCRVVFDCKPQRFLESGETPITLASGTAKSIVLNTYYPSYPLITVAPRTSSSRVQSITITNVATINGETKTMSATISRPSPSYFTYPQVVKIDCAMRSATFGELDFEPGIVQQTTSDFPFLVPPGIGTNSFTLTLTPVTGQSAASDCSIQTREYVV